MTQLAAAAADASAPAVLPNPVFEGSEKRVEIDFDWTHDSPANGLRALSRNQLDELMSLAACTIVSSRTNADLDAYVLSESSLFVYPTKWVLKTCGTTKLLSAVPRLLELAATIGMKPRRCKYSRASFLFPEQQVRGCSCQKVLCVCVCARLASVLAVELFPVSLRTRIVRCTISGVPPC